MDFKMNITCPHCEHEKEESIPLNNFFD
jgi:hypothetical protein